MRQPLVKHNSSLLIFASIVIPATAVRSITIVYDLLKHITAGIATAKAAFELCCKTSAFSFFNSGRLSASNAYNCRTGGFMLLPAIARSLGCYVQIHRLHAAIAK